MPWILKSCLKMWRRHFRVQISKLPLKGDFGTPIVEAHIVDVNFQIAFSIGQLTNWSGLCSIWNLLNEHILEAIRHIHKVVPRGNLPTMVHDTLTLKGRWDCHSFCTTLAFWILLFPIVYKPILPSIYT